MRWARSGFPIRRRRAISAGGLTRPAIEALQTAINETRVRVWRAQPAAFFDEAVIDADGTLAETTGQCKEGMDIAYNGVWGYHPLVVSLANTQEPLFLVNRSGNRPSAEGAAERFDQARTLCRDAGFRRITFRGDTDFSQTRAPGSLGRRRRAVRVWLRRAREC